MKHNSGMPRVIADNLNDFIYPIGLGCVPEFNSNPNRFTTNMTAFMLGSSPILNLLAVSSVPAFIISVSFSVFTAVFHLVPGQVSRMARNQNKTKKILTKKFNMINKKRNFKSNVLNLAEYWYISLKKMGIVFILV